MVSFPSIYIYLTPIAGSSFQIAFLCLNCYISSKSEWKQVEMYDKFSIYCTNDCVATCLHNIT